MAKRSAIPLSRAELQTGQDRVGYAEGLILQLPANHEGRNTWLLNYGQGMEAQAMRASRGVMFDADTECALIPPPPFAVSGYVLK